MSLDETAHVERRGLGRVPHAVGSALFATLGLILFALIFSETATFSPEAQPFPRLIATIGFGAAGLALAQALTKLLMARRAGEPFADGTGPTWKDIGISYAGPPLYGALLVALGFWIASAIFLLGLLFVLGERRLWLMAALAVGTLGTIYVVFTLGFGIRLPGGLLL